MTTEFSTRQRENELTELVYRAFAQVKDRHQLRASLNRVDWDWDIRSRQWELFMGLVFPGVSEPYACVHRIDANFWDRNNLRIWQEDTIMQVMNHMMRDSLFMHMEASSRLAETERRMNMYEYTTTVHMPGGRMENIIDHRVDVTTLGDSARRSVTTQISTPRNTESVFDGLVRDMRNTLKFEKPEPLPAPKPIGGMRGTRAGLNVTVQVKAIQFRRRKA